MRAIRLVDGELRWTDAQAPKLRPGHVRIRVRATAVNRADLLQRAGRYPPPPGKSDILGLECAGEVVESGSGAARWSQGDRVCALLAGGGYAEQVVVPQTHCLPVPDDMPMSHAASLPEVLTTAWLNLVVEGALQPGERVLLHAGASGVGTAAIQLLVARRNPVWVTAGSRDKIAFCRSLGALDGANRHDSDFEARVQTWTRGAGMDVILDPVGAAYLGANLRSLAVGGRLVVIGLLGGREAPLDLGRLLVRRNRVIGSVLRSRSDDDKTAILDAMRQDAWQLVIAGTIRPIIDRVLPIAAVEAAHAALASNETVGKVVLTVP